MQSLFAAILEARFKVKLSLFIHNIYALFIRNTEAPEIFYETYNVLIFDNLNLKNIMFLLFVTLT